MNHSPAFTTSDTARQRLALEAGVHPKIVQAMLGHSRIGTTLDRYSHVTDRLTEEAADRLDAGFRATGSEA